jgi:PIN like domain
VPYQAALEYQENRLGVIADQIKKYQEVKKVIVAVQNKLAGDLGQLQLKRRHSSIDPDKLIAKVDPILDEFIHDLDTLERDQPDVFDVDQLRKEIDSIFEGKIGPPPKTQAELDVVYQEGKTRYEQKRPPGYMDIEKDKPDEKEVYLYGGLEFKREYGDFVLWKQVLEQARENERFKQIIFITDDEKEDWWLKVKSKGEKIIGPQPELVEEIRSKSGVSSFYMYTSERFMEFAKKYLGADVKEESIEQVRDISQVDKTRRAHDDQMRRSRQASNAVLDWLQSIYPTDEIVQNSVGFPDFLVSSRVTGTRIGYEVQFVRQPSFGIIHRLRETVYRGYYEINEGRMEEFKVVFVFNDDSDIDRAIRTIRKPNIEIPGNISFVFGVLIVSETDDESIFTPISL